MRALAVLAIAVALVVPGLATVEAHHSPSHPVVQRQGAAPGWTYDPFTAPNELILMSIGVAYNDELATQLVHIYNAQGVLIAGFLFFYEGGADPDVIVTAGDVTVDQQTIRSDIDRVGLATVSLRCNSACSASRDFRVLVVSAGDVDLWGYGLMTPGGIEGAASRKGAGVGTLTTSSFDGVVADATLGYRGVAAAAMATHTVTTTNGFVGMFGKPAAFSSISATAQTPGGSRACFCVFEDDAAGTYTFEYTDADASATPGILVWADVDL